MWLKKISDGHVVWDPSEAIQYLRQAKDFDSLMEIHNHNVENVELISKDSGLRYYETMFKQGSYLPSGIYQTIPDGYSSIYLTKYEIRSDLEVLKFDLINDLIKEFTLFLESAAVYKDLKLSYKRGLMLYGPPGTGKTSVVNKLVHMLDNENSVIIFVKHRLTSRIIKALKDDQRLKIIIFEEFTQSLSSGEAPEWLLNFLDGEDSLTNCFTIATTNYPEKLPKNIVDRPGRFDKLFKIGFPSSKDIKTYLEHFNIAYSEDEIQSLKGKTLAELKELVVLIKRDNRPISDILQQLQKHKKLAASDFSDKEAVGFVRDDDFWEDN